MRLRVCFTFKILLILIPIGFVYLMIVQTRKADEAAVIEDKTEHRTYSGLSCYEIEEKGLPDILEMKSLPDSPIFFLEVTCKSINNRKIVILPRQACAVESAVLSNPSQEVYLLYTSPGLIKDEDTLSDRLLQILLHYKNVKIMHLNFTQLIKNTPVETLYTTGKMQSAPFPIVVASDTARLLTLQKYGGIYLDLDVIVLRSFQNLSRNCIGLESSTHAVGAVISVSSDVNDQGQKFIQLCLEELQNHFDSRDWGSTGPAVVTNVLKKMCNVNNVETLPDTDCQGFKVYPTETFHPFPWDRWMVYFDGKHSQEQLKDILAKSYMVHIWNKMSSDFNASSAPNSIFNTIAAKYCPRVFKEAGIYL